MTKSQATLLLLVASSGQSVGGEKYPRKFLMREKNLVLSRKKAKQSSSGSDHFEAALKSQVLGPTRPSISGQDFYTSWCVRVSPQRRLMHGGHHVGCLAASNDASKAYVRNLPPSPRELLGRERLPRLQRAKCSKWFCWLNWKPNTILPQFSHWKLIYVNNSLITSLKTLMTRPVKLSECNRMWSLLVKTYPAKYQPVSRGWFVSRRPWISLLLLSNMGTTEE